MLKISCLPGGAIASSSVSTQNAASIVIDSRHDSTRPLNQIEHDGRIDEAVRHRDVRDAAPDLRDEIPSGHVGPGLLMLRLGECGCLGHDDVPPVCPFGRTTSPSPISTAALLGSISGASTFDFALASVAGAMSG